MATAAYIDVESFWSPESGADLAVAFRPDAISSLSAIARQTSLILIADHRQAEGSESAIRLLAREGVAFERVVDPNAFVDTIASGATEIATIYAGADLSRRLSRAPHRLSIVEPAAIGWREAAARFNLPNRIATVRRETSETTISVVVNLDGRGLDEIDTGIGFFDHMLQQVARHSRMDIQLDVRGDLHIDEHHTIEDVAIVFGQAYRQAIGDKRGIERYSFVLPMDEALARVALDLSGRPWLVWDVEFRREKIGDMPTEMFKHFFKSFADNSHTTLNIQCDGENEHHKIESVFKAFGRCLGQSAVRRAGDTSVPSTKGTL